MIELKLFCAFQFGISDWICKKRVDSLYWLLDKRLSHSAVSNKLSTVVGVPTLVREYSECYQNSQLFAVTGITSACYGCIQNFRLHTLGVPVSNSDSREASQNLRMPQSSKFEFRFFFLHRDVSTW